jgi:MYXO-CTERM domain-containing protein
MSTMASTEKGEERSAMRKTAAIFGILALVLLGIGYPAAAQTGAGDAGGYDRTADDGGPDLGWLGLIGLAGLLGLRRREPHRDPAGRPVTNTTR